MSQMYKKLLCNRKICINIPNVIGKYIQIFRLRSENITIYFDLNIKLGLKIAQFLDIVCLQNGILYIGLFVIKLH
jgi:hypothetical protein